MNAVRPLCAALLVLMLSACDRAPSPTPQSPDPASAGSAAAAPVVDPEFAQLQALTPPDACAVLPQSTLASVYPGLEFELHQRVEPRLSGYAWDSRCTYWAGVGTVELAKDAPTHTVAIYLRTPATADKARANLAQRRQSAGTTTGLTPQPELGDDAFAITQTGLVTLHFVHGGSEVQIDVSDISSSSEDKLGKALALARAL